MNDKLLMKNYLLCLKSMVEVYVHGTIESSNSTVRDILKTGLDETLKHQARNFNEMAKRGWYIVKNVNVQEINKALKMLNQ